MKAATKALITYARNLVLQIVEDPTMTAHYALQLRERYHGAYVLWTLTVPQSERELYEDQLTSLFNWREILQRAYYMRECDNG